TTASPPSTTLFPYTTLFRSYPHMKLQVQPWPSPAGFLLSVNTHDQVAPPDPSSPQAEAFRALQAANQRYKLEIEAAWEQAGLPRSEEHTSELQSRENLVCRL